MKKTICIFLFALMALSGSNAFGATVAVQDSNTMDMRVLITNNSAVSAMSFQIVGLPVASVISEDIYKNAYFNTDTGDVIVYGLNNTVISGDLLFTVKTPNPYGQYAVGIVNAVGSNGEALDAEVTLGGDGVLAITFSEAILVATANEVIGLGVSGLDLNEDGIITVHDVQLVVNNLE